MPYLSAFSKNDMHHCNPLWQLWLIFRASGDTDSPENMHSTPKEPPNPLPRLTLKCASGSCFDKIAIEATAKVVGIVPKEVLWKAVILLLAPT
jgi:hypothetical protein